MDKVIDGMKGIKSNAKEAADAFNDFKSETTKQWDDPSLLFGKDGGGAVTEWLVKVNGGYTSAADAAKRLGINTSTLTDAVSGNEPATRSSSNSWRRKARRHTRPATSTA